MRNSWEDELGFEDQGPAVELPEEDLVPEEEASVPGLRRPDARIVGCMCAALGGWVPAGFLETALASGWTPGEAGRRLVGAMAEAQEREGLVHSWSDPMVLAEANPVIREARRRAELASTREVALRATISGRSMP